MEAPIGANLPSITQDQTELALALKYSPLIYFDANEPFLPLRVGYSLFREAAPSPSFPRQIELEPAPGIKASLVIEYAIWWDWDIQHLYELEHFWAYVNASGQLIYAEASWHGKYNPAMRDNALQPLTIPGTSHTKIYAQPGKHAFLPNPAPFLANRDKLIEPCTVKAGRAGLLVTPLFEGILTSRKTPEADALATNYLLNRAFTPAFEWTKLFEISQAILLPWQPLFEWIPARIDWLLQTL